MAGKKAAPGHLRRQQLLGAMARKTDQVRGLVEHIESDEDALQAMAVCWKRLDWLAYTARSRSNEEQRGLVDQVLDWMKAVLRHPASALVVADLLGVLKMWPIREAGSVVQVSYAFMENPAFLFAIVEPQNVSALLEVDAMYAERLRTQINLLADAADAGIDIRSHPRSKTLHQSTEDMKGWISSIRFEYLNLKRYRDQMGYPNEAWADDPERLLFVDVILDPELLPSMAT